MQIRSWLQKALIIRPKITGSVKPYAKKQPNVIYAFMREAFMQKRRLVELALKGLEAERERIDIEIAGLKSRVNESTTSTVAIVATKRQTRRKMSAAARRRISDAMTARWAAYRKAASKK